MDWNDPKVKEAGGGSGFFKFKPGENRIRIVSKVAVIAKHFAEGKYLGVCVGKEEGCQHCANGNKGNVKWLTWIIDRTDGLIKQAELGYMVLKAISDLAQNPQYGFADLPPYDITVTKSGEGLDTEYSVIADRQDTPLTDEEAIAVDQLEAPQDIVDKLKGVKETDVNQDMIDAETEIEPF